MLLCTPVVFHFSTLLGSRGGDRASAWGVGQKSAFPPSQPSPAGDVMWLGRAWGECRLLHDLRGVTASCK